MFLSLSWSLHPGTVESVYSDLQPKALKILLIMRIGTISIKYLTNREKERETGERENLEAWRISPGSTTDVTLLQTVGTSWQYVDQLAASKFHQSRHEWKETSPSESRGKKEDASLNCQRREGVGWRSATTTGNRL
ncbi:uncharacterized protein CLUP02_04619 [Colletotrichum lupini]|uniref:Uncharacterized protein n=1 Tax=Colletotrichum lupini TaxID=145971 RepID=A0A9Q8SL32_9PEZI|nr:uncharacterized protein CLUP02_04619 [Colletotrichum lupini]UQC79140.1 hypothetical protein CLUP02_04619 [Colletotrichum lupini]